MCCSASPAAFMRSSTSKRSARSTSGRCLRKKRLYESGRLTRPISYTSRKPRVVTSAVRAPVRSSITLMAMVLPCRKSALSAKCESAFAVAWPMPSTMRSGVVSDFPSVRRPARRVEGRDVGERAADVGSDAVPVCQAENLKRNDSA